jgi:hypothetical protein
MIINATPNSNKPLTLSGIATRNNNAIAPTTNNEAV